MKRKPHPCNRRYALLLAALVAMSGTATIQAQSPAPAAGTQSTSIAPAPPHPTFLKLDTNRDGYVSRGEARGMRGFTRAFNEADDNRDSRLDADEFTKALAIHDRLRAGQFVDDSVITAKVKAALLKDPVVKGLAVSVETHKGTVLLSGFVNTEQEVRRASEVAAGISGVINVRNSLAVKG